MLEYDGPKHDKLYSGHCSSAEPKKKPSSIAWCVVVVSILVSIGRMWGMTAAVLLEEYYVTPPSEASDGDTRTANSFGLMPTHARSPVVEEFEKELNTSADANFIRSNNHSGFIVLGMHRSGTSMLAGLLHISSGYETGGPLWRAKADNAKGFFERADVVRQNDEFMKAQSVWWSYNVSNFDWEKGIQQKNDGVVSFKNGKSALEFFHNAENSPWLQKDPRMCITLRTWLALMEAEPAILFTYRHPLEVAMSLSRREDDFSLERGLRLWFQYNMLAIQNSKGLCLVHSSNHAITANPMIEIQRISDELTSKCRVPAPPNRLRHEDVDEFFDPNLQHNNQREKEEKDKEILQTYNNGNCIVRDYETKTEEGTEAYTRETEMYGQAMKLFCDLESAVAFDDNYDWSRFSQWSKVSRDSI